MHSSSFYRSSKLTLFFISFATVNVEKWMKAQGQSKGSMLMYAFAQNIASCSRIMSTGRRMNLSHGQWDLLGACVLKVEWSKFRSSIIPDWHQIQRYSQGLCLRIPQTAGSKRSVTSVLWVIRISWIYLFRSLRLHRLSCCVLNSLWGLYNGKEQN